VTDSTAVLGVVREFSAEQGIGVIEAPETPGGCWVHYSAVAIPGYKSLDAGQSVHLEWEEVDQDGFAYRATRVWPVGTTPYEEAGHAHFGPSPAYSSTLTLRVHDATETQEPDRPEALT